jgi:hypothetical protein
MTSYLNLHLWKVALSSLYHNKNIEIPSGDHNCLKLLLYSV